RDGLKIDGFALHPPRFIVNRDPAACHSDAGIVWGNLKSAISREGIIASNGRLCAVRLAKKLRLVSATGANPASAALNDLISRIEAGDFRLLDAAAAARAHPGGDSQSMAESRMWEQLLNRAVSLLAAEQALLI